MDSDIVVNLRAGSYTLTAPFQLMAAEGDSGEHGHRVVYQAYGYGTDQQEQVVLSGGREISGWQPHDAKGIWRADVGDLDTRQLFVDGRRAERAALEDGIPGTATRTETGYLTDSTAPQSWPSPAGIEFVYQGVYPWSEGFLHFHGGAYYDGGPVQTVTFADGQGSVTVPGAEPAMVPGNVVFEATARIAIEGNRFTHLGANALGLSHGSTDNLVRGNVLDDLSGGGIAIGANPGHRRGESRQPGREQLGPPNRARAPRVARHLLTGTQDTTVAHNQVNDVPHCGIVANGGDTARGAQLLDNLVFTTMTVLADGGGIHLTSNQGRVLRQRRPGARQCRPRHIASYNFGLYTDYGAAWVTVQGNVVYRGDTPVVLQVSPPLDNVVFVGNLWDADPDGRDTPPEHVTVAGNTRLPRDDIEQALAVDPAGADIVANAGLEPAFRATVMQRNHVGASVSGGPAGRW